MLFVFVKLNCFGQLVHTAVHTYTDISALFGIGKHLFIRSLSVAHNRCQHNKALSPRKLHYPVDYLVCRLSAYLLTADRTVRNTDPRIKQPQIVINFGYGSNSRARVARCGFLVNGNRGRQSFDRVNIRLVHLSEKHSCI